MWRLRPARGPKTAKGESVKTRGSLSTNDGEVAVNWALDGHGILLRSEWDITAHLRAGRLVTLLSNYATPDADVYAVYPQRLHRSVRVQSFVTFMGTSFK